MSAFLSVFLFFSSFSVKANSVNFPSFPSPVEGQSSYHYFITYSPNKNRHSLYMVLDPNKVKFEQRSDGNYRIKFSTNAIEYLLDEGDSSWWEYQRFYDDYNGTFLSTEGHQILYSSFDIKLTDGTIFFQEAPIKANMLHHMKKVQMGAIMTTVVYLIPLLMVLLVSLIAFRKAWAWLLKVLRTA